MFTASMIPNHVRSSPRIWAAGTIRGTMMKAISKKSMKKPSPKTITLTTRRKPSDPPGRSCSTPAIQTSPSSPRNTSAKAVEPISRNMTMIVRRVVSAMAAFSVLTDRRRCRAASPMAPSAPKEPASVGVATPAKMLPSTTRISTKGGSIEPTTRRSSSVPGMSRNSSGMAGAASGRTMATPIT